MRSKIALTAILAAVSLAGCKSRQEILALEAAQDHEKCAGMGYERGTELYLQCRALQAGVRQQQEDRDERARIAFGQSMTQTGIAMMQAGQPRPVYQTRCNQFMGSTTCYTQ